MESGLLQKCQELPVEVPAGELSQLQVHVLQPSVSQAEAQELKQVRSPTACANAQRLAPVSDFCFSHLYTSRQVIQMSCLRARATHCIGSRYGNMHSFQATIHHNDFCFSSCMFKMLFGETTNQSQSSFKRGRETQSVIWSDAPASFHSEPRCTDNRYRYGCRKYTVTQIQTYDFDLFFVSMQQYYRLPMERCGQATFGVV